MIDALQTFRYCGWKNTLPEFRDLSDRSTVELSDCLTLVEAAETTIIVKK